MRVLVCGGRNYGDMEKVYDVLDGIHAVKEIELLIHGDATGADTLAKDWAASRGVLAISYPAKWVVDGNLDRGAGPKRNTFMLKDSQPDLVVAFPGATGTADMVGKARRAGVEVIEVEGSRTVWRKVR